MERSIRLLLHDDIVGNARKLNQAILNVLEEWNFMSS